MELFVAEQLLIEMSIEIEYFAEPEGPSDDHQRLGGPG